MTTRKRNEWLEAELSEDEDQGYDSEAAEQSKVSALDRRASKRRKTSESGSEVHQEAEDAPIAAKDSISADSKTSTSASTKKKRPKALRDKSLAAVTSKASKTGVIYLARVPPFMKPSTVRSLLTPHGEIGRIFLAPEDPESHKRRVRSGGNKKKSYTDGWVEFLSKKDAKRAAQLLNTQIIGGKKGSWYHDDLWNVKYLKGFKWADLTEQISNENAERAARVRAEVRRGRKEDDIFVRGVERGKVEEGMREKRRAKVERAADGGEEADGTAKPDVSEGGMKLEKPQKIEKPRRVFRQNEVRVKPAPDKSVKHPPEVARVLSKIF